MQKASVTLLFLYMGRGVGRSSSRRRVRILCPSWTETIACRFGNEHMLSHGACKDEPHDKSRDGNTAHLIYLRRVEEKLQ